MLIDLTYRLVLLAALAAGMAISATIRGRADRAGGKVPRSADGPWVQFSLRVTGLATYGSILLWLVYPPAMAWASLPLPVWARWSGAVLLVAGMALGVVALRHLGPNVTPTAVPREDAELVTTGPYSRVRHPLYASGLLTIPGAAFLMANSFVLVVGLLGFAVLMVRTGREERELVARFGEPYLRYMERTGRLLPRLGRGGSWRNC